ncbi:MAG: sulfatase [Pirellulales bacterium]|nr:sulfatase [Pirellulales bacterium]
MLAKHMGRLARALASLIVLGSIISVPCFADDKTLPNIVVIFTDDMGYGDLGCYGHPTIRTPQLDQMAAEGLRFTQFYSCAPVCTPSRAGLLTGRLPIRSGLCSSKRRVLFPDSTGGLPDEEITLAEALSAHGYQTICIGKWHLGHQPSYLPTKHGFDHYFGIPYSNDMSAATNAAGKLRNWPPLPLIRDLETIETEPDQGKLTERYTEEAIRFINEATTPENRERPFFLYLPHTMPHVPVFASERFAGQSPRGLYGDVIETIDWSTGEILRTLREKGLADNTLVFFTSDNGPWLSQKMRGGSAGLLRGGKGSTWEGGQRVPGIAWWPGRVKPATTQAIASNLDLFPTCLALAGVPAPSDRPLDGLDITPVLDGDPSGPRTVFLYYRDDEPFALRKGPWKIHVKSQAGYGQVKPDLHDPPLLFHLDHDPSETVDVAKEHPEVVKDLLDELARHKAAIEPGKPQLE